MSRLERRPMTGVAYSLVKPELAGILATLIELKRESKEFEIPDYDVRVCVCSKEQESR